MARRRLPPTDAREWLNRAESDPARARQTLAGIYLEDLCFDAQQAAEKAIKAVFIRRGESFPYVHDLARLLNLLDRNGVKIPKYVRQANELTPFAVESRYPGLSGPVSKREHKHAVHVAEKVLKWAERQITKP
jgi:HEPN domain-containing protein